ncbi:hypothetical protein BGX38DRAFT_1170726 [Terfezia claveryi]|nr:hypothetical protein BGX38DRAFT_1170726 [Terfezia claveryi]
MWPDSCAYLSSFLDMVESNDSRSVIWLTHVVAKCSLRMLTMHDMASYNIRLKCFS